MTGSDRKKVKVTVTVEVSDGKGTEKSLDPPVADVFTSDLTLTGVFPSRVALAAEGAACILAERLRAALEALEGEARQEGARILTVVQRPGESASEAFQRAMSEASWRGGGLGGQGHGG